MHFLAPILTTPFFVSRSPPPSPPLSPCDSRPLSSISFFAPTNVTRSMRINHDPDATLTCCRSSPSGTGATLRKPTHRPTWSASPSLAQAGELSSRSLSEPPSSAIFSPSFAPHQPPSSSISGSISKPPTWISTPPTPPKRHKRFPRPPLAHRRSTPHFPASASFSASLPSHAPSCGLKRCVSLPNMRSSTTFTQRSSDPEFAPTRTGSPVTQFTPVSGTPLATISSNKAAARTRPIFHFQDIQDHVVGDMLNTPLERSTTAGSQTSSSEASTSSSSSSSSSSSPTSSQNDDMSTSNKDDIRRYHALMELLSTEVGYLMDLRALVNVYLRFIHVAASHAVNSRSSLSFSKSRPHSLALLDSAPIVDKGHSKSLFSLAEVEILTRNAEDILLLHELFVAQLRSVIIPLGFRMEQDDEVELVNDSLLPIDKIDAAICAVATKFTTEASRFNAYEAFCLGHTQALEVVRKVQQRHPTEWDAFEHIASSIISSSSSLIDSEPPIKRVASDDLRAFAPFPGDFHPDGPVRTLRSRTRLSTGAFSLDGAATRSREPAARRLALVDYLIKPIQRICKYPLLLSQLISPQAARSQDNKWMMTGPDIIRSDVNVIVESALQAMRHVASAVDEARRQQDISIQSSLIISRITMAPPLPSQAAAPPQTLTSAFLTSLGACLLAGSLDVMHYPASGDTVKAKYLGAFLYMGGYLVLVKVCKGKAYEPRHWFSLADFELVDLEEDEAMLPCSFRLSSKNHHFELAAACRREKETWMSSLRESRSVAPAWSNEPVSSLQIDGRNEAVQSNLDDEPYEMLRCLPTIQSIPELNLDLDDDAPPLMAPTPCNATPSRIPLNKLDTVNLDDSTSCNVPPSRRSSTTSAMAIFAPALSDVDTIVIRRSSPSARAQVDQGLQDVISTPCLAARSHASTHEEELFQAPKSTRPSSAVSNSGLSMAGAMGVVAAKNRLMKHQSVRVPRRRSLIDHQEFVDPFSGESKRRIARTKSLVNKRHSKLMPAPTVKRLSEIPNWEVASVGSTQCSSVLASPTVEAMLSLPLSLPLRPARTEPCPTRPPPPDELNGHHRPKRTRSMVDSVRGFLHLFPKSPLGPERSGSGSGQERMSSSSSSSVTATPGLLRRWALGPFHRRSHSTSDVPAQGRMRSLPSVWTVSGGSGGGSGGGKSANVGEPNASGRVGAVLLPQTLDEMEFGVDPGYERRGGKPPPPPPPQLMASYHVSPPTKRRSFLTATRFPRTGCRSGRGSSVADLRWKPSSSLQQA